ncbi:MAG TPA: hypothetical protein VMV50_02860 [Candidatus Paceibacterota bacterium]|nr:hypothetical protein [Candidatus Paceibacterota bacterium]
MNTKRWIIAAIALLVILAAIGFLSWHSAAKPAAPAFPIDKNDVISSWTFTGVDTATSSAAKAKADIARLTGLLGKGQYDDYDIYIGIGNDEVLLGDGKAAYDAYDRAIARYPSQGLAYTDMAALMNDLGATHTALTAYETAAAVQPAVFEYAIQWISYLTRTFPNETALVDQAFAFAKAHYGDTPQILTLKAGWQTEEGQYAAAIATWKQVEALAPGGNSAAINAEIARLTAKEAAAP